MTGRTDTFGGKKRHLTLARTDFRDRLAGLPVHQIAKPAYLSLVLVWRQGERRREREKDEETEMNAAGKIELPFHELLIARPAAFLKSNVTDHKPAQKGQAGFIGLLCIRHVRTAETLKKRRSSAVSMKVSEKGAVSV